MTRLEKERADYPDLTDEEIVECCCPEDILNNFVDCPYPGDGHAGCAKHWNEEAKP